MIYPTRSRRQVLETIGMSGLAMLPALVPLTALAGKHADETQSGILLLIELAGGNDGLNTVIPIGDPAYRAHRPEIGIRKSDVLNLDTDTGLHPSMRGLADLWETGEVRIVEGVGYPNPNRSHFRSIEIWNTGGGPDTHKTTGWIVEATDGDWTKDNHDADGLVLGGDMGPMSGPGRFIAVRDPDRFVKGFRINATARNRLEHVFGSASSSAESASPLEHVLAVHESAGITANRVRAKLARTSEKDWGFPDTAFGQQMRNTIRLMDAGVIAPVFKVTINGFDTHANQVGQHAALLQETSDVLAVFAKLARQIGLWDRILVMTYSEFGRRVYENHSYGTDHGTAAPVLLVGGRVVGGFAGARPSLERLNDGDLVFTTDYREVYASVLADLWKKRDNNFARSGHKPVPIMKTN